MPNLRKTPFPAGATPLFASSGNKANANAVATLTPLSGQTVYVTGFDISSSGGVLQILNPTVTGLLGGTWTGCCGTPGSATAIALQNPGQWRFSPPLKASAVDQAVTLTLLAVGVGNTNASVNIYGYSL